MRASAAAGYVGPLAPWPLGPLALALALALALSSAPHAPGASRRSSVPRRPRPPPARCHIEPAIAGSLSHRAGPISGRPPARTAKAAGPTESDTAPERLRLGPPRLTVLRAN